MRGRIWVAGWGVFGVAATFVEAILRLGARAREELAGDLTPTQWAVLVGLTIVLGYGEGYRALQRRFAPSVVARSLEAASRERIAWAVFAPLYALSLIGAPARTIVRSFAGVAAIVACVLVVRELAAPWRGIVDGAVCFALSWGLVALLACFASALAERAAQPTASRGVS